MNVPNSARFITALIFPDTHLHVLSYNRCVGRLPPGMASADVVAAVASAFTLEELLPATAVANRPCTLPAHSSVISGSRGAAVDSPVTVSHRASCADQLMPCVDIYSTPPSVLEDSDSVFQQDSSHTRTHPTTPAEQALIYMYVAATWYSLRPQHAGDGKGEVQQGDQVVTSCDPLRGIGCQILLDKILNPIFRMNAAEANNFMIYGKCLAITARPVCVNSHSCSHTVPPPLFYCIFANLYFVFFAVDGREGAVGVERLVDSGEAAVGFLVCPVPTEEVMRVADAGQLLPAKVGLIADCFFIHLNNLLPTVLPFAVVLLPPINYRYPVHRLRFSTPSP